MATAICFCMDDDDVEAFQILLNHAGRKRRVKWHHDRIDWDTHIEKLLYTKTFQSRYHMSKESFDKLVRILRPKIAVNEFQSLRSTGGNDPITPEMIVGAGLRFLGGEYPKSLSDIYGMSDSSTERIIESFLEAVDTTEELKIKLPMGKEKLKEYADEWDKISGAFRIYYGVVGAIDGWLCSIEKPRRVSNPADYFSGHYQHYGLNIQAVCDSNLRFIYFGVAAPGRTNDARVYNCRCLGLRTWIESLPEDYFIVGDNAYPLSNQLLIPFSGAAKLRPYNRTYNFYLSQLRIRIEMTFGLLTTKWRIFRRKLDFHLEKTSRICRVAAILHNYVINSDNLQFAASMNDDLEDYGVEALLDGPNNNRGFLPTMPSRSGAYDRLNGLNEARRVDILAEIEERDMERPTHNLVRNQELDEVTVYEEDE